MVYNREEAAQRAEASKVNTPGYCQAWTNIQFHGAPVGDFDGDGDADAMDGWKSEPVSARHVGDRTPPRGVPVAYSGGSHGYGHRAISIGHGMIRSTDAGGSGRVATVDIGWPERQWGMQYLGWSETIGGVQIPLPPPPKLTLVQQFLLGGPRYDLKLLDRAVANGRTDKVKASRDEIVHQINRLRHISGSPRVNRFLHAFDTNRVVRTGLLSKAIKAGRTGTVKDVRARIMREINRNLPRR